MFFAFSFSRVNCFFHVFFTRSTIPDTGTSQPLLERRLFLEKSETDGAASLA